MRATEEHDYYKRISEKRAFVTGEGVGEGIVRSVAAAGATVA
jgi:hypothetical protein